MLSNMLAGGALGPGEPAAGGANIAEIKPEEPVHSHVSGRRLCEDFMHYTDD